MKVNCYTFYKTINCKNKLKEVEDNSTFQNDERDTNAALAINIYKLLLMLYR